MTLSLAWNYLNRLMRPAVSDEHIGNPPAHGWMNPDHHVVSLSSRRINCECGWAYTLEENHDFSTFAARDKLLDSFNEHMLVIDEYKCGACGKDRRNHSGEHQWKPKEVV